MNKPTKSTSSDTESIGLDESADSVSVDSVCADETEIDVKPDQVSNVAKNDNDNDNDSSMIRGAPSLDTPATAAAAAAAAATDSNPTFPKPLVPLEDLPWGGKSNPYRVEELQQLHQEFESCEEFHAKARNLPYLQQNEQADAIKSLEHLKDAAKQVNDYIARRAESESEDYECPWPSLLGASNVHDFQASLEELFISWQIRQDIQHDAVWSMSQKFVSKLYKMQGPSLMMLDILMEHIHDALFRRLYMLLTNGVLMVYDKVDRNTQIVRQHLRVLSGLNQADTTRSISRSRSISQMACNEENGRENLDSASCHPNKMQRVSMSDPDDEIYNFFSRHGKYDAFKNGEGISGSTLEKLEKKVPLINEYYEKIGFANYGSYKNGDECKTKVREAVENFGSYLLKEGNISQEQKEICVQAPCAHNYEVEGTQPWFYHCILKTVADCIDSFPVTATPTTTASTSPARKNFRAEALVAQMYKNKHRTADIMLHNQGRFNYKLDGNNMQSMGELKPGSRGDKSPIGLLEEALHQCLSHLAKIVMCGLNFAQAGVTAHATGFIANMAAVQIVHLKLIHVGTPEIGLVLEKTDYLPLMTKANFEKWAQTVKKGKEHASSFAELKKLLYGKDASEENVGMFLSKDCNQNVRRVIPMGYIALMELMMTKGKDLFGLDIDYDNGSAANHAIPLGAIIGSGSASIVFKHRDESKDYVVKVSRHGATWDIDLELGILKSLQKIELTNNHVPKLISSHALPLSIGGITVKVPAIVTSPRGTGVLEVLKSKTSSSFSDKRKFLTKVLKGLKSALEFLRSNNIYHCDINPRNIVIVDNEEALLIDFSIALDANKRKDRYGFWGTLNYVHRTIFEYYPHQRWDLNLYETFDSASLYFTMAVLVNDGELPWSPIVGFPKTLDNDSKKEELQSVMNERDKSAKEIMDGYDFDFPWDPTNDKSNKEALE
jgi:RIO-like serine/threonine protein kinase